jgi:hypothetical protein
MAFRLCVAFCLLASGLASMLRSVGEARLRERLFSDSWVSRANAAILLSDDRRAIPWLVALSDDPAPPVRANVRWALRRQTNIRWASNPEECRRWWLSAGGQEPPPSRIDALIPPSPPMSDTYGVPENLDLHLSWKGDSLCVSLVNHTDGKLNLSPHEAENYTAEIYGADGTPARILDAPEPSPASVETLIWSETGRHLASFWWNVDGAEIAIEGDLSETYDLSALPAGRFVAECRTGALAASHGDPLQTRFLAIRMVATPGIRRLLIFRR